jgi:hypothetical protein
MPRPLPEFSAYKKQCALLPLGDMDLRRLVTIRAGTANDSLHCLEMVGSAATRRVCYVALGQA